MSEVTKQIIYAIMVLLAIPIVCNIGACSFARRLLWCVPLISFLLTLVTTLLFWGYLPGLSGNGVIWWALFAPLQMSFAASITLMFIVNILWGAAWAAASGILLLFLNALPYILNLYLSILIVPLALHIPVIAGSILIIKKQRESEEQPMPGEAQDG